MKRPIAVLFFGVLVLLHGGFASAATVSEANVLSGGTAVVTNTFGNAAFAAGHTVDGTSKAHVFADGGGTIRFLSITGFNSDIGTIRFFDSPSYTERVAVSVKIYYSSSVTSSLNSGDYTLLGDFNLPTANTGGAAAADVYTNATSPADHPDAGDPSANVGAVISFVELTGLNIPAGTQSILFELTGSSSNGLGLSEVQAFSVPPAPDLSVQSSVTYSNDGSQEALVLPFSNSGSLNPLTISSVTVGGADAAYFTVDSFTSPVAAGANGTVDFTFNPSDGSRYYNATLTIASNDPDSPSTVVNVTAVSSAINLGKIICIGDSITEANAGQTAGDGNWSWRYAFWKHMVDSTIGHEFVGTRTANFSGTSVYPDYQGFSFVNKHEAIWGTTSLERYNSSVTFLNTLQGQGKTPDTAIIYVGGNDIPNNTSTTAETVRDRIKNLIDRLQGDTLASGNPNMRILLVSIIPRYIGNPKTTPDPRNDVRFSELNTLLAALAPAEATATSDVTFLDIFSLMENSSLYWDGVHPNGAGEQIEADQIFAALVPDRDNDGMQDAWELLHFPSLALGLPTADGDGDGINNLDEFVLGRDPTVNSPGNPLSVALDASQLSFTLPATSGVGYTGLTRKYILESSSTLEDDWFTEQQGTADGNTVTFTISGAGTHKFYRLRIELE